MRGADGSVVPNSLQPVDTVPPVVLAAGGAMGGGAERDAAVLEYLRGARELMAAEREVMLRYLGGTVEPAAPLRSVPVAPLAAAAPAASAKKGSFSASRRASAARRSRGVAPPNRRSG